jgi:hypothetical protein
MDKLVTMHDRISEGEQERGVAEEKRRLILRLRAM